MARWWGLNGEWENGGEQRWNGHQSWLAGNRLGMRLCSHTGQHGGGQETEEDVDAVSKKK